MRVNLKFIFGSEKLLLNPVAQPFIKLKVLKHHRAIFRLGPIQMNFMLLGGAVLHLISPHFKDYTPYLSELVR